MQNQGQIVDASMHRLTDLSETAHCKQGAGRSVNDGTHGTKTNALKHNTIFPLTAMPVKSWWAYSLRGRPNYLKQNGQFGLPRT